MEALVIAPQHKQVLSAMLPLWPDAQEKSEVRASGLVAVLTGPPGVGKRSSARAAAESCRKPLYAVAASQLGVTGDEILSTVGSILSLCDRWGAMLLIEHVEALVSAGGADAIGAWSPGVGHVRGDGLERGFVERGGSGGEGPESVLMRLLDEHSGVVFMTATHLNVLNPLVNSASAFQLDFQVFFCFFPCFLNPIVDSASALKRKTSALEGSTVSQV
jgi:hypothetical protein